MILSTVLLAGFWAAVGAFFKWALVSIGVICLVSSLVFLIRYAIGEDIDEGLTSSGIFAVPGVLLTLWWLFIPYWNVCQWILLVALLVMSIIMWTSHYCEKKIKYVISTITLVFGLFLLTKYVIIPNLKISLIVLSAIAGIFICYIFYKIVIIPYKQRQRRNLSWKLRSLVGGMPIPDNAVFDRKSEKLAKKALKTFKNLNKKIRNAETIEKKQDFKDKIFEKRLFTFYELSLRAESNGNEYAYSQFETQLAEAKLVKDVSILRKDAEEHKILTNLPTLEMKFISEWKPKIDRIINHNKDYTYAMQEAQYMDTTNKVLFWRRESYGKLAEQTKRFEEIHNTMISELEQLFEYQKMLNDELTKVRLIAYRNIYLGTELINYYTDSVSGKYLDTEKDIFSIQNQFNEILDVYNKYDFVRKNELKQIQKEIKEEISKLESKVLGTRGQLGRTLELMEAIIEFNNSFYYAYAPLRKKVFVLNSMLEQEDLIQISKVINSFNKVTKINL